MTVDVSESNGQAAICRLPLLSVGCLISLKLCESGCIFPALPQAVKVYVKNGFRQSLYSLFVDVSLLLKKSSETAFVTVCEAAANGELLRNQAKLMSSVACAGVPIVTVVVGNSYGLESYMMVLDNSVDYLIDKWSF
jgi:hypothetical protein